MIVSASIRRQRLVTNVSGCIAYNASGAYRLGRCTGKRYQQTLLVDVSVTEQCTSIMWSRKFNGLTTQRVTVMTTTQSAMPVELHISVGRLPHFSMKRKPLRAAIIITGVFSACQTHSQQRRALVPGGR